jgi:chloride channel 3/4/5
MIDGGFPVLTKEIVEHDGRSFAAMRIVGFLGMNELEHALGESPVLCVDVEWEAE